MMASRRLSTACTYQCEYIDDFVCVCICVCMDVRYSALQVVTHEWETAVEKLSLALCKHRVCVLTLSEALRGDVVNALNLLAVLLSANAFDFLQEDQGDGFQPPLLHPLPGMSRLDFRLGSAVFEKLPVEAQAFVAQVGTAAMLALASILARSKVCRFRVSESVALVTNAVHRVHL